MISFLEQTARAYYERYAADLNRHCLIVPSKRAAFFLKQALLRAAGQPLALPKIFAMDDFISHLAGLTLVDPLALQLELFDLLQPLEPELDFDQFSGWAGILLEDFSRLDKYLVDPRQLFEFMTEVKALERWDPSVELNTPALSRHFRLWSMLQQVYGRLKEQLQDRSQAYPGMAYRLVAEQLEGMLAAEPWVHYAFIGLNALSVSEETIIRRMVKAGMADTYWDSDRFYLQPDPNLKAGTFLRRYKANLDLPEWRWENDLLLTDEKQIELIGVSNATLQGKVVSQLLRDLLPEMASAEAADGMLPEHSIAVVFPDENLLLPVLHSLPEELRQLTITMGLCLTGTSLFNFIELLFELHQTALHPDDQQGGVRYNHKAVIRLLTHPYLLRYEKYVAERVLKVPGHELLASQRIVQEIVQHNRVLLSQEDLAEMAPGYPLLVRLFTPWRNHADAIEGLLDFVELFRSVYLAEPDAVELEYFYLLYTIVKRIDTSFQNSKRVFSVSSFKKFLYEQLRQTSLPFDGDQTAPVQLMGMLETRALDFETVILLSVNEDTLPVTRRNASLLPFDALKNFGLPTYVEQESIIAYHFYRLLQRAKKVYLLHVLPSDTYGAGERSRYVLQLLHDLARQNPRLHITERLATVVAKPAAASGMPEHTEKQTIRIPKDPTTLQQLRRVLQGGLSPSGLNSYVTCSLQFYFSRVAKLRESDAVAEILGADQFGNIVHQVLENLLTPFREKDLCPNDLVVMQSHLEPLVRKVFKVQARGQQLERGMNHLLYKVAVKVLQNFLQRQEQSGPFPQRVLGLEEHLQVVLPVALADAEIPVLLIGVADRIDLADGHLRVIDYKTGYVDKRDLAPGPDGLAAALLHDRHKGKLRQLWLYKYFLAKTLHMAPGTSPKVQETLHRQFAEAGTAPSVDAGIFSFRDPSGKLLEAQLTFSEGETLEDFVATSDQILQQLLGQLTDAALPFEKTHDLEACYYCPYTTICSRAEK